MYDHPFCIELCKTASLCSHSMLSALSAVSSHLGLFHGKPISPHPLFSQPVTPDFLHQKRPAKAHIFAPCAFLLCPASLCSTQTLLDSLSIHVTMGKRAAPDLRHKFTRRPPTNRQESWPKSQQSAGFLSRPSGLLRALPFTWRKPSLGPGIRSIPLHPAIDFSHAASYVWAEV